ncbi:stage II sporulation protein M [Gemmatimonas sp.]|uniref:stage II sporulation protein M n=1 Tax=Gemmatimonas sp. TaxID=1962908 RepID=UPI0039832A8C
MLARAANGVVDAKRRKGYIEDPQVYRPVMASQIATNNVQVTFIAFAGGMTAGLLTCWALIMNGVSIGAALGLYLSKGIGSLIFSFIAPHGTGPAWRSRLPPASRRRISVALRGRDRRIRVTQCRVVAARETGRVGHQRRSAGDLPVLPRTYRAPRALSSR